MARITSGPFVVPKSVDGTNNGAVEFLLIGMDNVANRRVAATVIVYVCDTSDLYPATPQEVEIFRQRVVIPARDGAVLRVNAGPNTFTANTMLRVVVDGNTEADEANGIVVALWGGKADGRAATSMIFKHEEFIEIES